MDSVERTVLTYYLLCVNLFLQSADGLVIGVVGVPIVPRINAHVTVQLPPSMSNQLITMSQVSSDNEDEVPVVSDMVSYSISHLYLLHVNLNSHLDSQLL
jgi:hypothetical protein